MNVFTKRSFATNIKKKIVKIRDITPSGLLTNKNPEINAVSPDFMN